MITQETKTKILSLIPTGISHPEIAKIVGCDRRVVVNILKTRKRVVVLSDTHCGHRAGLTPPDWQTKFSHFYDQQVEMWDWFKSTVELLKPDKLMFLGDAIDGKGLRSGGVEQITSSFEEQLKMFAIVLKTVNAKEISMVNGTPYHVGLDESFENFIRAMVNDDFSIKIGGHEFPTVHGLQFDLKHKIGSSSTPYGNFTPQAKAKLWNRLWADRGGQPRADIIIRGHVHKFDYSGDDEYLAIVMPALQGWGSIFGVTQCEKVVTTGLLWFDIYDGTTLNNLQWHWEIPKFKSQTVKTYEL